MAAGGFKTFTTGEVLTAADTNNFLMQGVLVFADAAARDAAITAPVEGQVVYLKDTNAVLSYDGSVYVAVGGSSPLTTKGDLYTFSTVDARLGVGANGTVLTAASGQATGLEWASPASGGMTSLATGTLSTGTVTLSAIDQTYNDLSLRIYKPSTTSASGTIYFRYNGITTASYEYTYLTSGINTINSGTGQTSLNLYDAGTAVTNTYIQLDFPGYSLVSGQTVGKAVDFFAALETSGRSEFGQFFVDTASANAPITSITIFTTAGTFDAGTYTLWGIK